MGLGRMSKGFYLRRFDRGGRGGRSWWFCRGLHSLAVDWTVETTGSVSRRLTGSAEIH